MKRRILAILCVLTVLVGVLAVTTAAQQQKQTFRVGYAKVDINPWVDPDDWTKGMLPIALSGYGESYARPAKGWMDDNGDGVIDDQDGMKATCIAVTDDNDKTMLFIAYDMINAADTQVRNVRQAIVKALDGAVAMDDIMMSASHSHFTPDTGVSIPMAEEKLGLEMAEKMKEALAIWNQRVIDQMVVLAKTAMADRRVASKIQKSEPDASDVTGYTVNGVRHYNITGYNSSVTDPILRNPTWTAGDNFGSMTDVGNYAYGSMAGYRITKVEHVTQSNDKMYLLQFSFDDGSQPIVLANWRGHTTLNRHGRFCRQNPGITDELTGFDCVSGDYFNAFRHQMELKGYRVSLVNGASGNINNKSRASSTTNDWSTIWISGNLVINGQKIPNSFKMVDGKPVFENAKLSTNESSNKTMYNKCNALGLLLSTVALEGLKEENMQTCEAGSIRNMQVRYGLPTHVFEGELEGLLKAIEAFEADEVASSYNNGKGLYPYAYRWTTEEGGDGKLYTLNSRFHVSTIKSRATTSYETTAKLELNAIMLGPNLAFVSGPGEMYDYYDAAGSTKAADNDWLELITKQYGTPFVLGYSNGSHSYIPNTKAFDYNKAWGERGLPLGRGSYGANISQVAQGGGEAMIAEFKRMLSIVNDNSTIRTAKCEYCGKVVDWEPLIHSNNGDIYMYTGHYYLMEDIADEFTRYKSITGGETVCLDLNGHKIQAQHVSYGRAFSISAGGVLSIMDSVGGGEVSGVGSKGTVNEETGVVSYSSGGTIVIYKGNSDYPAGELHLYSGAIKRAMMEDHDAEYGGTIYCQGLLDIKGGLVDAGHSNINGGTIHMTIDSTLNMSGGTIVAGEAKRSYDGLDCYRGVVNITGGTVVGAANLDTKANISGKVKIENLRVSATRPLQIGTLEEGSEITVSDVYTHGFFTNADGALPENAKYFKPASDNVHFSPEKGGLFAGDKWGCECGGTKPAGHTCKEVAWKAWTNKTAIPVSSGNYYLSADVVTASEQYPTVNSFVRLDMNGYDVTFKVPATKAPTWSDTEKAWKSSTRVLNIYKGSDYVLTDSTNNPGTLSRDTSALTAEEISHITNWGVLVLINATEGSEKVPASFTMYNGILDGSNSMTTGGGIVSSHNKESVFRMYGGTLKGGTACYGGAVNVAPDAKAEFYGGTILSGTGSSGYGDCVYFHNSTNAAVLSGDAEIQLLEFAASDTSNCLDIRGDYTGNVTLKFKKAAEGQVVGSSVNGDFSEALIACANNNELGLIVKNGQLVLGVVDNGISAMIGAQMFRTVQAAVKAYTNGVIVLQKDIVSDLSIPADKTVYIDLNGFDLASIQVNGVLYVSDTQTDDFTVSDGIYGRITGTITGKVNPVPVTNGSGYLMLKESDNSLSFHKVELWVSGMVLNPAQVGVSYLCEFRGDERVQENADSFGMALSTKGVPSVSGSNFSADCQISRFDTFVAGATGNMGNSTQLVGVMKRGNSVATNRLNAGMAVYGRPYIKLNDGSILLGDTVDYSLRDLIILADENAVWNNLSTKAVAGMVSLYKAYAPVMTNWNIPNLKAAAN